MIIGKAGCGKTKLLTNLLLRSGWLGHNNINIFGKSLFQPEYHILKKKLFKKNYPKKSLLDCLKTKTKTISVFEEMAKIIRKKSNVHCKFYESAEDVSDPRELSSEKKKLMVFNDLLLEKQITCESYYGRGRHSNVDFFLFNSKLFQTAASNNQREREFHLSVSTRSEKP